MIARCEVLEEVVEEFTGKYGHKVIPLWVCLDRTPAGTLTESFDYLPTEEEHRSFTGKIKGRIIDLAITKIWEGFNRRVRATGEVQTEKR
jgi:hypothetical protein